MLLEVAPTKVVCHERVFLQRVFRPNGNNGLKCLHGLEALGFSGRPAPLKLLLQDMEEGNDILQATISMLGTILNSIKDRRAC